MKKVLIGMALTFMVVFLMSSTECMSNGGDTQAELDQAQITSQAYAKLGLPAVTRFQEKGILKMIYELRDKADLKTYVYLVAEMTGRLVYVGRGIGYPIPYATQYSNPEKQIYSSFAMPQSEPNGLFMPSSAAGTWQLMVSQNGEIKPVYFEPNIVVSQFPLQ